MIFLKQMIQRVKELINWLIIEFNNRFINPHEVGLLIYFVFLIYLWGFPPFEAYKLPKKGVLDVRYRLIYYRTIEKNQDQNLPETDLRAGAVRSLIVQTILETVVQIHIFISNTPFR